MSKELLKYTNNNVIFSIDKFVVLLLFSIRLFETSWICQNFAIIYANNGIVVNIFKYTQVCST